MEFVSGDGFFIGYCFDVERLVSGRVVAVLSIHAFEPV